MKSLMLVEHDHQQMNPSTLHVLKAALSLSEKPTLLVIGYGCESVAREASMLAGVEEVLWADAPEYAHFLAENTAQLIASLADPFEVILAPSSTYGKNIVPRVAALLDVPQISDVTACVDTQTFEHPIYAGNALQTVRYLEGKKIITVRVTAFDAVTEQQAPVEIKRLTEVFKAAHTRFIERRSEASSSRPELTQAKRIVSGGRGLQEASHFKLIEDLADVLGAAVGASRAAVDAGFVTNDHQVGQTGKIVAPTLYVAVGISGAIQHLAGMKDSKVIVAINKDEDAPIFQVADYGLVGDLFVLVPQLIEQLKEQSNLRE
ncbi:MAG: electron transfer flavoprotein subunit alpha/FixB family protein [Legionellaceae bacterium]